MLTSLEDIAVFRPVAEVLGRQVLLRRLAVAGLRRAAGQPAEGGITKFLDPWRAKYGERDPNWAARGWDGVLLTAKAIEQGKSFDGPQVRDQLEVITGFQGTTGVYNMSTTVHQGITVNPLLVATIINGQVKVAQ
jgi:branched-chain amino acid transport system substrate-binding protein